MIDIKNFSAYWDRKKEVNHSDVLNLDPDKKAKINEATKHWILKLNNIENFNELLNNIFFGEITNDFDYKRENEYYITATGNGSSMIQIGIGGFRKIFLRNTKYDSIDCIELKTNDIDIFDVQKNEWIIKERKLDFNEIQKRNAEETVGWRAYAKTEDSKEVINFVMLNDEIESRLADYSNLYQKYLKIQKNIKNVEDDIKRFKENNISTAEKANELKGLEYSLEKNNFSKKTFKDKMIQKVVIKAFIRKILPQLEVLKEVKNTNNNLIEIKDAITIDQGGINSNVIEGTKYLKKK